MLGVVWLAAALAQPTADDAVGDVVKAGLHDIRDCYNEALGRAPNVHGKITLGWSLDVGRVVDLRVVDDTAGDEGLTECMLGVVGAWQFGDRSQSDEIVYPFLFRLAGGGSQAPVEVEPEPDAGHTWAWLDDPMPEPPDEPWLQLLLLATGQDGARAPVAELDARMEALCAAGTSGACTWPEWRVEVGPPDHHGAAAALEPSCAQGDPVSCLAVAWSLTQPTPGWFDPERAADPRRAFALFTQACADGLLRGCTEVGLAWRFGVGPYTSRTRALAELERPCREGDGQACRSLAELSRRNRTVLLERAARLGDAVSMEAVGDHEEACAAGLPSGCTSSAGHASEPEAAAEALQHGCALGDVESCVSEVLWRAERGVESVEAARDELEASCADLGPPACLQAGLLGVGLPARTFRPGTLSQYARQRVLADLEEVAEGCYGSFLLRGAAAGTSTALVRIGADGVAVGAAIDADWADDELRTCLSDGVRRGVREAVPDGGVAEVPALLALRFGLLARLAVDGTGFDRSDVSAAVKSAAAWSDDLTRCVEGEASSELTLGVRVARSGTPEVQQVLLGSGSDSVDQCILEVLPTLGGKRLLGAVKGRLHLEPVETVEVREADAAPPPGRPPLPRWEGEPIPWRVLAILVTEGDIPGEKARLTPTSLRSIRTAHDEAGAWVAKHTRGQVAMHTDFLEVDLPLHGAFDELAGVAATKWRVEPGDLPGDLIDQIPAGQYHSIYLWAPIPRGFPQPALGTAWDRVTLRGATFASSVLTSGREVVPNAGMPGWVLVVHELYHQLEFRARRHLGTELPSNHARIELLDGRELDPREWITGEDARPWYRWAFDEALAPELWTDLLTFGQDVNGPLPGNLAYSGRPLGPPSVSDVHVLNDAIVDFGHFLDAATSPNGDDVWFAVTWPVHHQLDRVVAHLSADAADESASVRAVAIDIDDGGEWVEVAAAQDLEGPRVELAFPATRARAVRVRVVELREGVRPACRELEVYGPGRGRAGEPR